LKKVKVVGAGFSGLTTAYYLQKKGFEVEVYEASSRVGGLISSFQTPFGLVETAANALLNSALVEDMFEDIGLIPETTLKKSRKRFLFYRKPKRWPLGFFSSLKLIFTVGYRFIQYFVLNQKQIVWPRPQESVSMWVGRLLSPEFSHRISDQALQGIYGVSGQKLSASLLYRSLFLSRSSFEPRRKLKYGVGSVSAPLGMGQINEKIHNYLVRHGVRFFFDQEIELDSKPKDEIYVLCTSLSQARKLLSRVAPSWVASAANVKMLGIVSVTAFYENQGSYQAGFGCLFPESEKVMALGVLFNHCIFKNRSKVRSETWMYGGERWSDVSNASEIEIRQVLKSDRFKLWGYDQAPLDVTITRWPEALPHYGFELENHLETAPELPENIYLGGNHLGALGLSKILSRSFALAEKILKEQL
jgi:oxygen-dependent protoporphyrinogen oxidase